MTKKTKPIAPPTTLLMVTNKYNYVVSKGQKIANRSMTLQNDTPSLAQMLGKLVQDMPVRTQPGVYPGDMNHEDEDYEKVFKTMDMSEREDVLTGIKAMTERLRNLSQEYEKEAAAKNADPSKQAGNADGVQP